MPIIINTAHKPEPPEPHPPRDDGGEASGTASGTADDGGHAHAHHAPHWVTVLIEAAIIVIAIALALLVRHSVYDVSIVTSSSMAPTLKVGDRIAFDHRKSLHGQWRRGDIVFFDPPGAWQTDDPSVLVKRVIALPGETIEVRQGHVFVDGKEETSGAQEDPDDNVAPLTLGEKQYFVMGDNRQNSADSRRFGPIERDDVRGRAVWRLWPSPGRLP